MKRWNLSELFSQLDLPHEQLPQLYTKEEISSRNVKKKVLSRIASQETIAVEEEGSNTERLLLGIGIAAALVGGGVGTYAASNIGEPQQQTTPPVTIQSSLTAEEIKINGENTFHLDYTPMDLTEFTDAYECYVEDTMDKLDFAGAKVQMTDTGIKCVLHFKAVKLDASLLDVDFLNVLADLQYTSGGYSSSHGISGYLSDEENLYLYYDITLRNGVTEGNEVLFTFGGLAKANCDYITVRGMKNLLGFKGAEISQNKPFTEEQLQYIEENFIHEEEIRSGMVFSDDSHYYHKEDVYETGDMKIRVDLTEETYDKYADSISVPADIGSYSDPELYQLVQAAVTDDQMEKLNADIVGIRKDGYAARVLLRYTPQEGYDFTSEDLRIFGDVEAEVSSISANTGQRSAIDSDITHMTYFSENAVYTSQEIQKEYYASHAEKEGDCLYHELQITLPETKEAELELVLTNLENYRDETIEDRGIIRMTIPLGTPGEYSYSVKDSFETEEGIEIHARFTWESMELTWDSADGEFENVMNDRGFCIVTVQGYEYPLMTDILTDDNTRTVRASAMYDECILPEDITALKYNGEVIYEAAQ